MTRTDSVPFQDETAAVSVRENQREAEIGRGANPHWHRNTDRFETYSPEDFQLGYAAARMTLQAVITIAGARLQP